jgi:hypothetical protein
MCVYASWHQSCLKVSKFYRRRVSSAALTLALTSDEIFFSQFCHKPFLHAFKNTRPPVQNLDGGLLPKERLPEERMRCKIFCSRVQRIWYAVPVSEVADNFVLHAVTVDDQTLLFRWELFRSSSSLGFPDIS